MSALDGVEVTKLLARHLAAKFGTLHTLKLFIRASCHDRLMFVVLCICQIVSKLLQSWDCKARQLFCAPRIPIYLRGEPRRLGDSIQIPETNICTNLFDTMYRRCLAKWDIFEKTNGIWNTLRHGYRQPRPYVISYWKVLKSSNWIKSVSNHRS